MQVLKEKIQQILLESSEFQQNWIHYNLIFLEFQYTNSPIRKTKQKYF